MNNLLNNFIMVVIIAIISVGVAILWRTVIYTRGAIFRPFGRLLDLWVYNACRPDATLWNKMLRFIAFPLGRCIYCSQVHIGYSLFFYINHEWQLNLYIGWLVVLIPIGHVFTIIFMKMFIDNNTSMKRNDWGYMSEKANNNKIFDWPTPRKLISPLSQADEDRLEQCKSGLSTYNTKDKILLTLYNKEDILSKLKNVLTLHIAKGIKGEIDLKDLRIVANDCYGVECYHCAFDNVVETYSLFSRENQELLEKTIEYLELIPGDVFLSVKITTDILIATIKKAVIELYPTEE